MLVKRAITRTFVDRAGRTLIATCVSLSLWPMIAVICCVWTCRARRRSASVWISISRQRAATRAKALADPTRFLIALALRDGEELCVCDLAWITARAENLVGHHLRALRDAPASQARGASTRSSSTR